MLKKSRKKRNQKQRRKMKNRTLTLKIFQAVISILLFTPQSYCAQTDSVQFYCSQLKNFVKHYKPTYVDDKDTLVVSKFTLPNSRLNSYLLKSAQNKDYRLINFCLEVLKKQYAHYLKANGQDYVLGRPEYSGNGYLELMRSFLELEYNKKGYGYLDPIFVGEFYSMMKKKKLNEYSCKCNFK